MSAFTQKFFASYAAPYNAKMSLKCLMDFSAFTKIWEVLFNSCMEQVIWRKG